MVRSTVVRRYRRALRSEPVARFQEGFTLRCRVVGAPPHLMREGTRVRPAAGTDPNSAGELVFVVVGV